jgi:hypothetical protein
MKPWFSKRSFETQSVITLIINYGSGNLISDQNPESENLCTYSVTLKTVFKIRIFERRFETTLVTTLVVNYGSGNSSTVD